MSELMDLYQELILDHGRKPRHCCLPACYSCDQEGFNPFCGDKVHLYCTLNQEVIEQISFQGQGCAISMASTSLMLQRLQGCSLAQAHELFTQFHHMMMQPTLSAEQEKFLDKLVILQGVKQYPSRVKCATLAWHTLETLLQGVRKSHVPSS